MLAMVDLTPQGIRTPASSLTTIASMLAPTVKQDRFLLRTTLLPNAPSQRKTPLP